MKEYTRRAFLATAAGTLTAAVGTQQAGSQSSDYWQSDNVAAKDITIEYDEQFLKRYRPMFVADIDVARNYLGLYGYKATSPEYNVEYAYYWSQLAVQDGLPLVSKDSHLGDHEPVICAVDPGEQTLERCTWANYHHYAAQASARQLNTVADEDPDQPTHPVFRIDSNWHNYYAAGSDNWTRGDWPLRSWPAVRDEWRANGFYEGTSAAAIEDAQVMDEGRGTWWADGTNDRLFVRAWEIIDTTLPRDIGGAEKRQFDSV